MTNPLAEYHNRTSRLLGAIDTESNFTDAGAEAYDQSTDLAITLLASAGLGPESPDAGGSPINDDVQTLLMLALLRCPELRDMLERAEQLYSMNVAESTEGDTYNTA